jgi:hypothetical protein
MLPLRARKSLDLPGQRLNADTETMPQGASRMSKHPPIKIPLPENLPFIDRVFKKTQKLTADEQGVLACAWLGMDFIGDEMPGILERLNPETFQTLLSLFKPTVLGQVISSHEHLNQITQENLQQYSDFNFEQLKTFFLIGAECERAVDWRKIAYLYNESPDDQKEVISEFFDEFRLHLDDLDDLMLRGYDWEIPAPLLALETKEIDGEQFVLCPINKDWVLDYLFHRQFKISYTDSYVTDHVAAYAGTLEQAIAKATTSAIMRNGPEIDSMGRPRKLTQIELDQYKLTTSIHAEIGASSELVATAALHRSIKVMPDSTTEKDCKLLWGPNKSTLFREREFRAALYKVEKLYGLQWSKVNDLDNALGL